MRKWMALAIFAIFFLALFIIYLPLFLWLSSSTGPSMGSGPAELPSIAMEDINIPILAIIALLVLLLILLLLKV